MSSNGGPRPAGATARPTPLSRLADILGVPAPSVDVSVSGVTHDSSTVRPGDLFAALPGARHHGAEFLSTALDRGAVAVLTDARGRARLAESGAPGLVVLDPRAVLGAVAAEVYGHPAESLLVLGVTGTNGKTTTAHLLHAALTALGRQAGLVGTIETRVGDEVFPSVRTTPESTDLQALLATMRERGADAVAMEASSIAIEMGRLDGVVFDVVGFTNLSQDHLDYHGDMESYFAAKAALFTPARARHGVVTIDDEHGRRLADSAGVPVTTVSTTGRVADWQATELHRLADGTTGFTVIAPGGAAVEARLALAGRFNVANALLAVAMLAEAGVDVRRAVEGVASCVGVPGRMELVDAGQPFTAIVDYAHTPEAVHELLDDVRAGADDVTPRIVLILGCGGDRDAAKRPLMGAAAARGADVLVATDDNPRSEDPVAIRAAFLAGAREVPAADRAELHEVADRAAAIRLAVDLTRPGDVLVVAGKGHEQGQESQGVVTPFDDRAVLRGALLAAVRP